MADNGFSEYRKLIIYRFEQQECEYKELSKKINEIEKDIVKIKVRVATVATLVSLGVSMFLSIVLPYVLRKLGG